MSSVLTQLADVASAAAAAAAARRPLVVEQKAIQDFVTDVDRWLEAEIRAALTPIFPNVPILGEESIAEDEMLPPRAVLIDPLDGTVNWIAGLPFSAVSIAYIENGATLLATVASINSRSVYTAEAGRGAWREGEALHAAKREPGTLMALSTGIMDVATGAMFQGMRRFGKLRNLGSQALQLCAVAQGSLALNASMEARLWDDAAGRLIATEAGARYRAAIDDADINRPAARQKSLCAHPAIFDEADRLLRPVFGPTTN